MGQIIKRFNDNLCLEIDRGSFDDNCVYVVKDGKRTPPRDVDYFQEMRNYGEKYGNARIYGDFVKIYDLVTNEWKEEHLLYVTNVSSTYGADSQELDMLFTILYMGMIAEERKANTRLGKRIKRLGVHMLLLEGREVDDAANCMRGMNWREIDALCKARKF